MPNKESIKPYLSRPVFKPLSDVDMESIASNFREAFGVDLETVLGVADLREYIKDHPNPQELFARLINHSSNDTGFAIEDAKVYSLNEKLVMKNGQ